jgi:hypothetical protein
VFAGSQPQQLDQGDEGGEPSGAGRDPTIALAARSLSRNRGRPQQRDEREQRLQR